MKLHLVLDHYGYLPSVAVITEGNVADVRVAASFASSPGRSSSSTAATSTSPGSSA